MLAIQADRPNRRRWNRWIRLLLWIITAGTLALIIWCSSLYYVITHFTGIPGKGAAPVPADAGIVLGASLWDNKPSPGLQERLDLGLKLYRSGAFKSFIVTGGLDTNGATITEAEGMREYLLSQGVPQEAIVLDPLARNTYENLLNSRQIMQDHGWKSAIIVTHSYHGSRAADIARKLDYSPIQVSVMDSKVLNMSFNDTREVLAYTKWLVTKLFL
jgi:uncharacterized SAM-binding protein YcdF (DUF218 family)